jgi:TP901 family phage tail tape measure protein
MNSLVQIGIVLTAIDKMSGVINGATDKATHGFTKLQHKISEVSAKLTEMGTKASVMGHGILTAMETPIKAFADLDDASTNLRVAMMDNLGQIPPQIAEINKQSIELGNILKGNTADFTNAATALLENGTSIESITNGGLKSASYLGVVLKQVPAQAAEMTAKFREAFGLADNELVKMADLTQRAKFGFGLNPEEIKYAAQYAGSTLNNLKLTGIANTKMFLAMQGIARQKGMEGSVFGTNFSSMLNNIGQMEQKLGKNSKVMKEINADLRHAGISMQFFDSAGHFVGLEKMVGELEKLKVLTEQEKLNVMNKIFGSEGGRVAAMLSEAGVSGLHRAMDTMARQADLMQRIEEVNKSARNTWEALTGTIENFWAAVGGPVVTALYPLIHAANDFVGGPLMDWVAANQDLVKWLGLGALAVGGLLVVLGGLGIVAGAVASGLSVLLGVVAAIVSPIGIAVAGIAAGAALIIQHWGKISAFFRGVWQGISAGLAPLKSIGSQVAGWFAPILALGRAAYNFFLRPWVDAISQLISWFGRLIAPITQTETAAQAFGYRVGRGIAEAIKFVAQLAQAFFDLPAKLYNAGVGMIDQLLAGIKSAAGRLYAGVAEVAAKVRSYWPFSPAKEGPLRDLNRVRIIETIAESVHPASLVNAMRAAATAGMLALAPLTSPAMASLSSPAMVASAHASAMPRPALAAAPAHGGGAVTVHFAPQITIQGGTGMTKDDLIAALKERQHELVRLIEEAMARNARRQY